MLKDSLREAIIENIAQTQPEAFVVDIRLNRGKQSVLSIKVDTDKGISLAECAGISRKLGAFLEDKEEMDFRYKLEVSSPGVGYPLLLHRQYVTNKGRFLQVKFGDGTEIKGKLTEVTDNYIVLGSLPVNRKKGKKRPSPSTEQVHDKQILFSDINEAKVIII